MTRIRETARLRAKERALRPLLKAVRYNPSVSMRWRYFHAAHPRASICCKGAKP